MTVLQGGQLGSERPVVVTICGQPFRVEFVAEDEAIGKPPIASDPFRASGCMELVSQRIGIREGQAHESERDCLVHEIVHAVLRMTSSDDHFENYDHEEACVNALSVGLLAVLRQNPGLVAWLVG